MAVLLERKPQRKLHLARIVRAGNLAEARGSAEGPAGPDRRVQVRVIEEIKYVQAELQSHILADGEFLLKRCVEVVEAGPDHNVTARVAIGERSGHGKAGRVEPFRRRFWTAVRIANQIRPLGWRGQGLAVIGIIRREIHRERRSALQSPNAVSYTHLTLPTIYSV